MPRDLLTGNAAAAWGARLADVDYVPAYPITPQTEIIEALAQWIACGELAARMVTMDSEHSMLTAAGAAAATGARVFTASSSQGLLYALEMLYTVAGWRVPLVLVNVARAVASPITLEPDHNDVLAARDSGFLQIHAETCQEVVDSILMAYRLAEHADVLLPALVNLDGFYLSFTREPVELPEPEAVRQFLPAYTPTHARFCASHAMAQGVAVLGGSGYTFFKYQMQRAAEAALAVHDAVAAEFRDRFGRAYGAVDGYHLDDAEWVIVMSNSFSTVGKAEVTRLRQRGVKVGLLRLRLIRPFPHEIIAQLLGGRRAVAVIDQNISVGKGGILFAEVKSALPTCAAPPLVSFIGGLGGRRFRTEEFDQIVMALRDAENSGGSCEPHLLYSAGEFDQLRGMLRIAHGGAAAEEW
ncbi:MAG TPA: pyruvate synthase [Candidatus Margulisiibacteriota bacterium]|nr:pyruvate synthase [Candidatus Margulisiibacteriota bacterium]